MIAASNAHVLSYDNLSNLRLADEFARLATGAGFPAPSRAVRV